MKIYSKKSFYVTLIEAKSPKIIFIYWNAYSDICPPWALFPFSKRSPKVIKNTNVKKATWLFCFPFFIICARTARFKQKQRLGRIYDSEIQAYLGSGVKKFILFFYFFRRHFSTSFFSIFIVHLLYQVMWLESLNGLISKVVFWTT